MSITILSKLCIKLHTIYTNSHTLSHVHCHNNSHPLSQYNQIITISNLHTHTQALLGTYRCSAIPGEFNWKIGVLAAAVRDGHWVRCFLS